MCYALTEKIITTHAGDYWARVYCRLTFSLGIKERKRKKKKKKKEKRKKEKA
jgi:hypothetical protein